MQTNSHSPLPFPFNFSIAVPLFYVFSLHNQCRFFSSFFLTPLSFPFNFQTGSPALLCFFFLYNQVQIFFSSFFLTAIKCIFFSIFLTATKCSFFSSVFFFTATQTAVPNSHHYNDFYTRDNDSQKCSRKYE